MIERLQIDMPVDRDVILHTHGKSWDLTELACPIPKFAALLLDMSPFVPLFLYSPSLSSRAQLATNHLFLSCNNNSVSSLLYFRTIIASDRTCLQLSN